MEGANDKELIRTEDARDADDASKKSGMDQGEESTPDKVRHTRTGRHRLTTV